MFMLILNFICHNLVRNNLEIIKFTRYYISLVMSEKQYKFTQYKSTRFTCNWRMCYQLY